MQVQSCLAPGFALVEGSRYEQIAENPESMGNCESLVSEQTCWWRNPQRAYLKPGPATRDELNLTLPLGAGRVVPGLNCKLANRRRT